MRQNLYHHNIIFFSPKLFSHWQEKFKAIDMDNEFRGC